MATVRYTCPIGGTPCGDQDEPGMCGNHFRLLIAVRDLPPPPEPEPEPGPVPVPVRAHLAVQLLDRTEPVDDRPLVIGRDSGPFAGVPGMPGLLQVSRVHAELRWVGAHLHITDLESVNGTFVNGHRLAAGESSRVCAGDRIRLGLDVEGRVVATDEFGLPL